MSVTAALSQLEADIRAIEQTSGSQDAAISQLPDSTHAYREAKSRLYALIKDISHAAGDLEAAAKDNAKRLYQRRSKGRTEAPAAGGSRVK